MTVVCRIDRRYPVVTAALYGTLDHSAAIETVVTLHGCLAEQPVQLLLEATHLDVSDATTALWPLAGLVHSARRWPGTRVAVSGASPALRELFAELVGPDAVDFYPDQESALAGGFRLPVPPREMVELPAARHSPAASREVVARACRRWRLDRWSWLTQLLTSELVTNAVVHARTPLSLTLRHLDHVLQVAVQDGDPRLVEQDAVPTPAPVMSPQAGRGLLLLAELAEDWGSAPTSDGKVTWANVAIEPKDPGGPDPAAGG